VRGKLFVTYVPSSSIFVHPIISANLADDPGKPDVTAAIANAPPAT